MASRDVFARSLRALAPALMVTGADDFRVGSSERRLQPLKAVASRYGKAGATRHRVPSHFGGAFSPGKGEFL